MPEFAFFRRVTSTDRLSRAYDAAAGQWQKGIASLGYPAAYDALAHAALASKAAQRAEVLLDVGTGSGAMGRAMLNALGIPAQIDLMDMSDEMLNAAKVAMPEARSLYQGLLGQIDLPAAHYDRVTCAHVIEHGSDPLAQIRWLAARLKPGGQLVMAVSRPHWCTAIVRFRWGHAAYRPQVFADLLKQAGLSEIEIRPHAKGPPARTSCGYVARRP